MSGFANTTSGWLVHGCHRDSSKSSFNAVLCHIPMQYTYEVPVYVPGSVVALDHCALVKTTDDFCRGFSNEARPRVLEIIGQYALWSWKADNPEVAEMATFCDFCTSARPELDAFTTQKYTEDAKRLQGGDITPRKDPRMLP
ncbi:hypothetical protein BDZ89DRAFT_1055425 [Hymenopellis radicata]|nr:hypothetical protein BDZ89DRAFT_1055425 [Hymenopellis radicata]